MADFSSSFRALYGLAIPAELHEIVRFESIAREGGLSGLLGDVALISEAVALYRPIDPGIENMLVFMCVNQTQHVDYYCFRKAGEVTENSMPVVLVTDQTIVQAWPDFGAFLAWAVGP